MVLGFKPTLAGLDTYPKTRIPNKQPFLTPLVPEGTQITIQEPGQLVIAKQGLLRMICPVSFSLTRATGTPLNNLKYP